MNRTESLLNIRPTISHINNDKSNALETFQNEVLRPILKFQHEHLLFTFLTSDSVIKLNFKEKDNFNKEKVIVDSLKSNHKLKAKIIQSILSLMTIEELTQFQTNKSEYQNRIISMATQRIIDGAISK